MTQATFATHEVFNQSPPFEDVDLFAVDRPLMEAVAANGGAPAQQELSEFGQHWGSAAMAARGRIANENTPKLRTFDSRGNRRDEVEFHPAYHEVMARSAHAGIHNSTWTADGKPAGGAAEVVRAARFYMASQVETGHLCPITMTRASVAALAAQPDLLARVMPILATRSYDPTFAPWPTKRGMTLGMGMTEKQGGTDVRSNMTRAERDGDAYRITGHKWFMSAPMCDAFLVLAQSGKGLSCFLMPRWTPDGERNAIHIVRLKDKLGNRSNASSEVEFDGATAQLIGEEGRGIPIIIEMAGYTRLDCCIGSSSLMRQAVAQAVHHARHRTAFQKRLIDQPLMSNVLADLALESEAATVLTMRLARAYDESDEVSTVFRRVVTPAAKFWICKRAPFVTLEAMEVLGGSGYIEESILPRLYREAPVNSIWEGAGNIMCLDVLRAIERTPKAAEVLRHELAEAGDTRLQAFAERLQQRLRAADRNDESQARVLVRDLVLALQAALLIKHSPPAVADAFCASRLGAENGGAFGTLPRGLDLRAIAERATPLN